MNRFVLLLIATCLFPCPAFSEEPPTVIQTIQLYEGVLKFPPPVWVDSPSDLKNVKFNKEQTENTFTFEQIPKDQEFDSWTKLCGIYGYRLPDYDMDRFFKESLQAISNGCKVQLKIKAYSNKTGERIVLSFCDDLDSQWVVNGNNAEAAVIYMSHVDQSFVKVYQSYRYPAGVEALGGENGLGEAFKRAQRMHFVPIK